MNFNAHVPKESPRLPEPPHSLTAGPARPHPAPPAPARARPRSRRPWRRAPAETPLPPHRARRADWLRAPPERGGGSGAALIGCGAGSTRRSAPLPLVPPSGSGKCGTDTEGSGGPCSSHRLAQQVVCWAWCVVFLVLVVKGAGRQITES